MPDEQEIDRSLDALKALWNHRPSMNYAGLTLVFNEPGDLVIERAENGGVATQVTIPAWQLDLMLAFIKRHRLSPMLAGLASGFSQQSAEQE
jgi:hypothetical protein